MMILNMSDGSVLSDSQILYHKDTTGNVVIEPFYPDQLNNTSYDVTLGKYYYSHNTDVYLPYCNPWNPDHLDAYWGDVKQAGVINTIEEAKLYGCDIGDKIIIIKSQETILGHTNEFIGGRRSITTMMKCRSSLGRIGIKVCACSGWGDIGYIMPWTFEITNTSEVDIVLIVGQKVAQIVFFTSSQCISSYEVNGTYQKISAENINAIMSSWTPQMMKPKLKKITSRESTIL